MRAGLIAFFLIILSPLAMAETLTPDMIKQVHEQVKTSFFNGCSKDVKGSVVDICRCLAEKTQMNLDDTALSKCNNDMSGQSCLVKVVKDASTKATTPENITECKKKVEALPDTNSTMGSTPANSTTTPSSSTKNATPTNSATSSTPASTQSPATTLPEATTSGTGNVAH